MPVKFDNIDLNSDVVQQNDEVNKSESTVRAAVSAAQTLTDCPLGLVEGLGYVDRVISAEAEMRDLDRDNDAKMDVMSGQGEIEVDDDKVGSDLKGNVPNSDVCGGDSLCSEKNEAVEKNFSAFAVESIVDRSGEGSAIDEVGGKVYKVVVSHCGEGGEDRSAGLQPVEEKLSMATDVAGNLDLASGSSLDDCIPDYSMCSESAGQQLDGSLQLIMEDGDLKSGSGIDKEGIEVKGDMGILAHLSDDKVPHINASGSSLDECKPDSFTGSERVGQKVAGSSHLMTADGHLKSGSGIDSEGTEVKGDMGLLPCSSDTAPHINGFGSNGNQGVVITAQMEDIQQPQDIEKKNVKQAALKMKSQVKECRTEKNEFHVSDLVWGKVRSHPWWPGQIFDPYDASEKARKYCKKDGFLIAYFGDQTFAWNEASRIKPFETHFSQMVKQSNSEAFCHAVDCALEEVSRRVEFGLACSCLPEEVYDRIKTQIIVNAGIREESSRRDGRAEYSSMDSFMHVNLVQYLKALAQSPYGGTHRLEFVIAHAQLLAFNCWKGFEQLPEFKMLGGLLEDGADIPVTGEEKYSEVVTEDAIHVPTGNEQVPLGKGKLVIEDTPYRKRKEISGDGATPLKKKERCMSDLMSWSHSKFSNGDTEPEGKAGRKLTSLSSINKRKAGDSESDDSTVKNRKSSLSPVTKKQFFRVGESIRKVASQLAVSTPILKDNSKKTVGENGRNKRPSRTSSEKSKRKEAIQVEYPPPDEMLSQLSVSARDPMKNYLLLSSVSFFSNFRNSLCLENSISQEHKKSTEKVSGKHIRKKLSKSETTEASGVEVMEDSYWTDMIVQSNTEEEQVLFEPEVPNKKSAPTVEPEAALELGIQLDSKQETAVVDCQLEGKSAGDMDEKCEEEETPTTLILNFTDLESVPSESILNEIFSRYGPLNESVTEVMKKSKRAKVVFKRRSDAETAFSSTGKFSIFGPSLVSYRLNYSSSTPRKTSTSATKRGRKGATSVEGNAA